MIQANFIYTFVHLLTHATFDLGSTKPEFYVAIKGVVYDVTSNKDKYVSGQDYSVFVGKDASLLLAKSSVNVAADCGYSQKPKAERDATLAQLTPAENKVLDDWVIFFRTRYNVVGELTD